MPEPSPSEPSAAPAAPSLDLRGTPCPLNFIRARLALEKLPAGGWLQLDLDAGEAEQSVVEGLNALGHEVQRLLPSPFAPGEAVRLRVRRDGG